MKRDAAVRILIVDDEPLCRRGLRDLLHQRGIGADTAGDGHEALRLLRRGEHRLVISDLAMPGLDGLGLLRLLKRETPSIRFVLLTGVGNISTAVTALKEGAEDVIEKPITRERLAELLARLETCADTAADGVVTVTPAMRDLLERARRIAATEATILIQGESGTGKELIARAIHGWSSRAAGPFVAVNCAAMPETLVESELFGHERGAFTDARTPRAGVIEQADGGTLFLDEIGEMPLPAQAKLLRVLQDRCVRRLGGAETREVHVRFIAASNRNLRDLVRERQFREDLYFRLDVMALALPPLRERPDDIPLLARHFVRHWGDKYGRGDLTLSTGAVDLLLSHQWPGNVRELENAIHRAVIESEGTTIEPRHVTMDPLGSRVLTGLPACDPPSARAAAPWPAADPAGGGGQPAGRSWGDVQRDLIFSTLAQVGGNRRRAAEIIGIGERTLRNKLKEYREAARP